MTPTIGWTMTVVALAQVTEAPGGLAMTPTFGWVMTVVALAAVIALGLCMRRSKRRLADKPDFKATPRETVKVSVKEKCDADTFTPEIDPWHVYVTRGKPLKWDFDAPKDSTWTMRIVADDPGKWPFPSAPPAMSVGPGGSIPAGNVNKGAPLHTTHKYTVVLECDGRTFNIDPDIYIWV